MTTTPPLFSIIIPTYNHGHLIGRCLDSLESQSYTNWEAIVVNNYSEDDTIAVVERYADPRIRLVNFSNGGVIAASRNRGIEEARGEWICFLDSDDWWTPDKLEQCLPYLVDYDLIYHRLQLFSEDRGLCKGKYTTDYQPQRPIFETLLRRGNCCANSSVVLRRSVAMQVGPISQDKELVAVEDYDYWLRVSLVTERFYYLPFSLGYYWVSGSSASVSPLWLKRHQALYTKYLPILQAPQVRRDVTCGQAYHTARVYAMYKQYREARPYYKQALGSSYMRTKCASLFFLLYDWLFRAW